MVFGKSSNRKLTTNEKIQSSRPEKNEARRNLRNLQEKDESTRRELERKERCHLPSESVQASKTGGIAEAEEETIAFVRRSQSCRREIWRW